MLDLIARLEAATGPDRELDGDIWWASRTQEMIDHYDSTGYVREVIRREGSAGKALELFYSSSDPACLGIIAFATRYTSSIDAALTLVPEGFRWKLGYSRNVPCVAELTDYRDRPIGRIDGECDSNHAIALCIAALKARLPHSNEQGPDNDPSNG